MKHIIFALLFSVYAEDFPNPEGTLQTGTFPLCRDEVAMTQVWDVHKGSSLESALHLFEQYSNKKDENGNVVCGLFQGVLGVEKVIEYGWLPYPNGESRLGALCFVHTRYGSFYAILVTHKTRRSA